MFDTFCRGALDCPIESPLLLMRFIPPHFIRPALLQNALRHTFACSKFPSAPTRALFPHPRRLFCSESSDSVDNEMGKDDKSKAFNLKVPKGTRDCTALIFFSHIVFKIHLRTKANSPRDWRGRGPPRPSFPNRNRRLQAPRRDHARHARLRTEGDPQRQIRRRLETHLRPPRPGRRTMLAALRPHSPACAMARHEPQCAELQALSDRQGVPS